jgi:hypothetical protein
VKTAISIPDELFIVAEDAAQRLGVSRSELYRRALREFLAEHDVRAVTEALDTVYGGQPEVSHVDSGLMRLQLASLPDEEW